MDQFPFTELLEAPTTGSGYVYIADLASEKYKHRFKNFLSQSYVESVLVRAILTHLTLPWHTVTLLDSLYSKGYTSFLPFSVPHFPKNFFAVFFITFLGTKKKRGTKLSLA
ncbi:hypothetical protein L2D08_23210 [Domibacillus sp. PGB-M46]|uniref:hypothetical protein n=1 Tax=Domibacillus sp. PGB-M46 TaxID=2910255 RepID=UPI001F55EA3B|nr:hypothetical protein [Domibacillus sp. PGB-M46]MCI2257224.1 hypothetical protein [Domibacillus sp. PGB-M46]